MSQIFMNWCVLNHRRCLMQGLIFISLLSFVLQSIGCDSSNAPLNTSSSKSPSPLLHKANSHLSSPYKKKTTSPQQIKHPASWSNQTALSSHKTPQKPNKNKGRLQVEELLVASGVRRRRLVGVSQHFPASIGSLWSLTQVDNLGSAKRLMMRWWRGKELKGEFAFVVGRGLQWREWSRMIIQPTDIGRWKIEVYDPLADHVLKTSFFHINDHPSYTPPLELKAQVVTSNVVKSPQIKSNVTQKQDDGEQADQSRSQAHRASASLQSPPQIEDLKIHQIHIAQSIRHRRPLGIASQFTAQTERLWCYIEVNNSGAPNWVWMEWWREDVRRSRLRVSVGQSKRWRTWSWQRFRPRDAGYWEVRVLSAKGELLRRTQFIINSP